MNKKHILLALLVTFVWGVNFPLTDIGLQSVDPFVLTGVRFLLAALPWVFFVRRPSVPFRYVVAYGLIFGIGMWGVINYGIRIGVSPGIASLIIQFSAFFTMGWGALLFKERLRGAQVVGAIVALCGLAGIISAQQGAHAVFGLLLIVLSAVAWSVGNVIIKRSGVKEILSFMVWASLFPPLPLLAFSFAIGGAAPFYQFAENLSGPVILSIGFQVYLATHFAYWGWNSLLKLYPVSTVAPLSLLIPVFGLTSSMLIIGERVNSTETLSIVTILVGLGIGLVKRTSASKRATA